LRRNLLDIWVSNLEEIPSERMHGFFGFGMLAKIFRVLIWHCDDIGTMQKNLRDKD